MKKYKYIIIGGGMTGSAAAMAIRKNDPEGAIAMFTKEAYVPYNRPPLTKGLWGKTQLADIDRPMEKYNVDLYLQTPIQSLYPDLRQVVDQEGEQYLYGKLLIATGGVPITLPNTPEGVTTYRTREDYQRLRDSLGDEQRYCIVGGGFIGSELAAALTNHGKQVTMIFPEAAISARIFPDDLSEFVNQYYQKKGVQVLSGHLVKSIESMNHHYRVQYQKVGTDSIKSAEFDRVILGVGIRPDTKLAEKAGLPVDNGIIVSEFLQTDEPRIYAAGDVANFFDPVLNKRRRVEHEDNANSMGARAGENMSGAAKPYQHSPFFYSDMFDLGYEAVGETNKEFTVFEDWIEPYKKGTLFFHQDGKVRGLIFWNLWGKVDQGLDLIGENKPHTEDEMTGMFTG